MNILYVSYMGLLEPLGQSQVLGYLRLLSREHRFTLITFEKPENLENAAAVSELKRACDAHQIRWLPQRYHHRPRLLATAWDLLVFVCVAMWEARRADLVHARSYIPSFVALAIHTITGKPFIFDMRAFWPEEMITAGRLKRGSLLHRLLRSAEQRCLRKAAAVVSLTHAAVQHMQQQAPDAGIRFVVIPTCADLDRFKPPATRDEDPLTIGCVGTVLSGWFRFDLLIAFFKALASLDPTVRLRIVTRDSPVRVAEMLREAGFQAGRVEVFARSPAEVPGAMGELSAATMFFDTAVSELARCPTRMGEALGCGVPVVASPGVGDVAQIIGRYRVGVLVEENTAPAMQRAVAELQALLKDPELPARCRLAAEEWFSLENGAAAYARLYAEVA